MQSSEDRRVVVIAVQPHCDGEPHHQIGRAFGATSLVQLAALNDSSQIAFVNNCFEASDSLSADRFVLLYAGFCVNLFDGSFLAEVMCVNNTILAAKLLFLNLNSAALLESPESSQHRHCLQTVRQTPRLQKLSESLGKPPFLTSVK